RPVKIHATQGAARADGSRPLLLQSLPLGLAAMCGPAPGRDEFYPHPASAPAAFRHRGPGPERSDDALSDPAIRPRHTMRDSAEKKGVKWRWINSYRR